ncbi:glycosyl transferase [Candidatus Peregrinibacteria bacterium CG22_combo_CG10-13_8_21_14_all_49_11]|nr:MAG: glycosyl transferase [Candidatus Peregrinibacteria bacterium CG22_combo_CG10-13_8_21_14_all_49_11]
MQDAHGGEIWPEEDGEDEWAQKKCYTSAIRTAIIADWLTTLGGTERVLQELCTLWPDAVLYTTVADERVLQQFSVRHAHVSKLQILYRILGRHQLLLFAMPRAIEDIDLRSFDLIISSSHAVAKGIIPPPHAFHICYCHTPARYAWEMEDEYLDDFHIPSMLRKPIKQRLKKLRRWDMTSSRRTDAFIANSSTTQERIMRIYARESTVIPPPVHDRFFAPPIQSSKDYFLSVGRLVPYKRLDLLIDVANATGIPLVIAGEGQDHHRLQHMAGKSVTFLGRVPEEELPTLYAEAKAFLFPAHEDAGIVPLEAQACGTPVIAYGKGGALDTIEEGKTGLFFTTQTAASLTTALETFQTMDWDRQYIRNHARQFSQERFRQHMRNFVHTQCTSH